MSSDNTKMPALVRLVIKTLDRVAAGAEATDKALAAFGRDLKKGADELTGKAPPRKIISLKGKPGVGETFDEALTRMQAEGKTTFAGRDIEEMRARVRKIEAKREARTAKEAEKQARAAAKAAAKAEKAAKAAEKPAKQPKARKRSILALGLANFRQSWRNDFSGMRPRDFIVPNAQEMQAKRWPMAKAVVALLGAAALGGAVGVFAYATPFLFPALFLTGAPIVGIGMFTRAVGFMLKQGPLRDRMRQIGNKALTAGTLVILAPMALAAVPAFAGLHMALTTGEVLLRGARANIRAAARTLIGREVTAAGAKPEMPTAPPRKSGWRLPAVGQPFRKAAKPAADAAPAAEAAKPATPAPLKKPEA